MQQGSNCCYAAAAFAGNSKQARGKQTAPIDIIGNIGAVGQAAACGMAIVATRTHGTLTLPLAVVGIVGNVGNVDRS